MGQGVGGASEAPAVGDAAGREPIGRYIAQQRKLRGIALDDLAARTRIPRRSLERLESGAFDHSPDGFSRGFVRTVAEAIGLDPDDAVARMLPEPDAAPPGGPRWLRVAGVLGALVAVIVVALVAAERALAPAEAVPTGEAGQVRHDYVRALADERGARRLAVTEAAIVLAPLPPPAPAAEPSEQPAASAPVARAASTPSPLATKPPAPPAPTPSANPLPAQAQPSPAPAPASTAETEDPAPAPSRALEPDAEARD
jgi:transcriptional regulator with XRE-family HTH domain